MKTFSNIKEKLLEKIKVAAPMMDKEKMLLVDDIFYCNGVSYKIPYVILKGEVSGELKMLSLLHYEPDFYKKDEDKEVKDDAKTKDD